MKVKRMMIGGAILVMAALLLSGCSISDAFGKLIGRTDTGMEQTGSVLEEGEKLDSRIIDPSLEKPVFLEGMAGEKDVQAGTDLVLETQASVNDGGVVTYQWYSNNVSSNGGGTLLKDMRESTYRPDTGKGGTTYYYVLATNTKDGKVNLSTSDVYKVTVWEDMYWQQNADLGAYQYISRLDGKFPKAVSIVIDGAQYHFDADGFAVNENGEYIDVQTGQAIAAAAPETVETSEAPADAAAVETPAETEPAEAAPAEAQPAEAAPAEAQPAEAAPAETPVEE